MSLAMFCIRLIEGAEPDMLAPLSMILCGQTSAPREVVRRLACHEEATVAAPILRKSEALSDSDLIEIANRRGQQHLLAISERKTLDEALTDALLKRGDIAVYRALASNAGARFSDQGCLKLAAAAERDGDIADALAVRPTCRQGASRTPHRRDQDGAAAPPQDDAAPERVKQFGRSSKASLPA